MEESCEPPSFALKSLTNSCSDAVYTSLGDDANTVSRMSIPVVRNWVMHTLGQLFRRDNDSGFYPFKRLLFRTWM